MIEKHFKEDLTEFAEACHDMAVTKGFWSEGMQDGTRCESCHKLNGRNKGELVGLIHSECSELLESARSPELTGHLDPDFTLEEEEAVDILIRVFDYAVAHKLRLAEALLAKYEYNSGRVHKHGKVF